MSASSRLEWLPHPANWRERFADFSAGEGGIETALWLANARLDFVRTNALDAILQRRQGDLKPLLQAQEIRLAILGSSTLAHLHATVRVAGLRRNLWISTYENDYGQYFQELSQPQSALYAFAPTAILFVFDAYHLTQGLDSGIESPDAAMQITSTVARIRQVWQLAHDTFNCPVLQQTGMNLFPTLIGNNEYRLPGSRHRAINTINEMLREAAVQDGIALVSIDDKLRLDGLLAWHDPALWHRSKQEISPAAAPAWGEQVARVLAAQLGRSYKALVLDLDNTLWGGVVGDDGLEGIVLGQGSALGEGFASVQQYALELSRRGVILAVASKNDEANALEPFERHPEMILQRKDIASFRADWNDKAGNIRAIAQELNIGLDSLVFLDDNPFERSLVRQELPMVAVPEVPEDPALVPYALAAAGYFESIAVTGDDRARAEQYQGNLAREKLKASATDIHGYLRALEMCLTCSEFDQVGLQRTVQLINKTNQFNLTTRRYSEEGVTAIMRDPKAFGLQLRLVDKFGDNGIIAIVIGKLITNFDLQIDTWLMSCRVLGRQVESATLNIIVENALRLGAKRLIGEYIPTKKNGMVRDHYQRLGFSIVEADSAGRIVTELLLEDYEPSVTFIHHERS